MANVSDVTVLEVEDEVPQSRSFVDDGLPWHWKDGRASSSELRASASSLPTRSLSHHALNDGDATHATGGSARHARHIASNSGNRATVAEEAMRDAVLTGDIEWQRFGSIQTGAPPNVVVDDVVDEALDAVSFADTERAKASRGAVFDASVPVERTASRRRMSTAFDATAPFSSTGDMLHSELRIWNIPKYYTLKDVCEILSPYGEVASVRAVDPETSGLPNEDESVAGSRQPSRAGQRTSVLVTTTPASEAQWAADSTIRRRRPLVYCARFVDERATSCAYLALGHVSIDHVRLQVTYVNTHDPFYRALNLHHQLPANDASVRTSSGRMSGTAPVPSRVSDDIGSVHADKALADIREATERARLQRCVDFVASIRRAFFPMGLVTGFFGFIPFERIRRQRSVSLLLHCLIAWVFACYAIGVVIYACQRSARRRSEVPVGDVALGLFGIVHLVIYIVGIRVTNTKDKFRRMAHHLTEANEVVRLQRGIRIRVVVTTTMALVAWLCFSFAINFEDRDFLDFLPVWARVLHAIGLLFIFGACSVGVSLTSILRLLITICVRRYGERIMRRQVDMDAVVMRYSDISLMVHAASRMFSAYIFICFAVCIPMGIFAAYAIIRSGGPHIGSLSIIIIAYIGFLGNFWYDAASPIREMGAVLQNFRHVHAIVPYGDTHRVQDFLEYTRHDVVGFRVLGFVINERFGAAILYVCVYLIAIVSFTKITT